MATAKRTKTTKTTKTTTAAKAAKNAAARGSSGSQPTGPDLPVSVDALVSQVLAGHSPNQALATLLQAMAAQGTSPFAAAGAMAGFGRAQPRLLPRRDDVVTFRVRVDVDGAKPPIWRRLDLASDLPLDQVHRVLQDAIGWEDAHLHAFTMGPDTRDLRKQSFRTAQPFDVFDDDDEGIPEADVRLDEVLAEPGHRLFYEYDFGDGWTHTIRLEEVRPRRRGERPARCVGGRREGPPEDCGGVWALNEMVAAHSAGMELEDFPYFEPAHFDVDETDDVLSSLF